MVHLGQVLLETLSAEVAIRPELGIALALSVARAAATEAPDDVAFAISRGVDAAAGIGVGISNDWGGTMEVGGRKGDWEEDEDQNQEGETGHDHATSLQPPLRGSDLLLVVCCVSGGSGGSGFEGHLRDALVQLVLGCRLVCGWAYEGHRVQVARYRP